MSETSEVDLTPKNAKLGTFKTLFIVLLISFLCSTGIFVVRDGIGLFLAKFSEFPVVALMQIFSNSVLPFFLCFLILMFTKFKTTKVDLLVSTTVMLGLSIFQIVGMLARSN